MKAKIKEVNQLGPITFEFIVTYDGKDDRKIVLLGGELTLENIEREIKLEGDRYVKEVSWLNLAEEFVNREFEI